MDNVGDPGLSTSSGSGDGHSVRGPTIVGIAPTPDEEVLITVTRTRRHRHRVMFGVPWFHAKSHPEGKTRQMTIKIPNDAIGSVPLIFTDAEGHPVGPDINNVTAVVTDPTQATAAVTSDGNWVVITPLLATGGSTVTYTDNSETPPLTATVTFSIVAPAPVSASFNEAGIVLTPNPSPPAGAAGGSSATTTGGASTITGGASSLGGGTTTITGAGSTLTGGAA